MLNKASFKIIFTLFCFFAIHYCNAGLAFTLDSLETAGDNGGGNVYFADIDNDGNKDLLAGLQWFRGADFKAPKARYQYYKRTYGNVEIGKTAPYDFDGDGDLDILANCRETEGPYIGKRTIFWFENPGKPDCYNRTIEWSKNMISTSRTSCPEILEFYDIDNDGKDELIITDDCGKGLMIVEIPVNQTPPTDPKNMSNWIWTTVHGTSIHGVGIGDINEDNIPDLVADFSWYEQGPVNTWTIHDLGDPGGRGDRTRLTSHCKVCDVDGDGDNDIIMPRAHGYGIYWFESTGGAVPGFTRHQVTGTPSTIHGAAYADIDGDGDIDVFAGKSVYNHGDVGQNDPLEIFWMECVRSGNSVSWEKHMLTTSYKFGSGPLITDIDNDKNLDLIWRPIGYGGRYEHEPKNQKDVMIFYSGFK